jgi:peptidoglycan/xylan/chitin deacetylase (PgdA/CDA1 family)
MDIKRLLPAKRNIIAVVSSPDSSKFIGQGMVSFSYDDGHISHYKYAMFLHMLYNIPATFNIVSDLIGISNTWLSSSQIQGLAKRGHEIASHSKTHPTGGTSFGGLSSEQTYNEASLSKIALENLGVEVNGFVVPGSSYADFQVPILAEYYDYVRAMKGRNDNPEASVESAVDGNKLIAYPMKDTFDLCSYPVAYTTTTNTVIDLIDQAIAEKKYIIFMMHKITDGDISGETYLWDKAKLETVLAHIASIPRSSLIPVTVQDGVRLASIIQLTE